jgi:hypothetical protein
MTIYFVGGEDTSYLLIAGFGASGSAIRTGFARYSMSANGQSTAIPPTARLVTPQIGPATSLWYHARYGNQGDVGGGATINNSTLMAVADSAGTYRIIVASNGTSGILKISKRDNAGTLTTLATSSANAMFASIPTMAIDLFVNYAVSGQATLYINGQNVCDTGPGVDVTTNSVTALGQLILSSHSSSGGNGSCWSEVIIQDTSTFGLGVQTLAPVAAGNTQSWTPNTVGNINPNTFNDATFVSASTNNSLQEWTLTTTNPTGSWSINAVVQEARFSAGATGPQHFEWLLRTIDGSDNVSGSVAPPIGTFGTFSNMWLTNPHTGAAWGSGELINAGIESLA